MIRLDLLLAAAALLAPATTLAKPPYLGALRSAFRGAPVAQQCQVCHSARIPQLNLFGEDFRDLKSHYGVGRMAEAWADLRRLDSNHDGTSNEEDLMAGRNPGVAPGQP